MFYLCFKINKIPDLTMTKYSTFDISGLDDLKDKHGVFLRQLYRLGYAAGVYFHLLYVYDPSDYINKGHHLDIIFYATSENPENLKRIREFVTTSVLSAFYDFYCYELTDHFELFEHNITKERYIKFRSVYNSDKYYKVASSIKMEEIQVAAGESLISFEISPDLSEIVSIDQYQMDSNGRFHTDKSYKYGAFITKKAYSLPALNSLPTDVDGPPLLYSIFESEPNEDGRLFNVLKLMEGYNEFCALRIDLYPVDMTREVLQNIPYSETRKRIAQRNQGRDDNSENMIKAWDDYIKELNKYPQFQANIIAFADHLDIAVMLADSVGSEAVESGTYRIEEIRTQDGYSISPYYGDDFILKSNNSNTNFMSSYLSLYTLNEIRPMFSFPILNQGETIERVKETDPIFYENGLYLGLSETGYKVTFPIKLFKKHAFISGVPGGGKTNTMLYLVTNLWRQFKIPFLVLEPAKQEYRALARIPGMEELCIFSPKANTRFPLHINPFEFPIGLTLAEHIANLKAVFEGAFELPPPSPHFIDTCIEQVYIDKGWNTFSTNDGTLAYPTMQDLYDSLKIAVENSSYEGEIRGNLRAVLEVRVGSLLKREIGNVYNVKHSIIRPEEWLNVPAIIELEALGEGPANFMSLLISTLIRESLKIRMTVKKHNSKVVNHIIFYEEAHNLIGPDTDSPLGDSVDPKISATKYLVKMLAEVRALNEGIVIADQLPTVMAPEVLKNTGLKIGHRITAQDDRQLLGSTMSASAAQLEEQASYLPGDALVTYEGLLKPFKMKIAQWEDGKDTGDSPDDKELFDIVKHHERSITLMRNSAEIMNYKIDSEFLTVLSDLKKSGLVYRDLGEEHKRYKRHLEFMKNQISSCNDDEEIQHLNDTLSKYTTSTEKTFYENLKKNNLSFELEFRNGLALYEKYSTIAFNFGKESITVYKTIIDYYYELIECILDLYTIDSIKKAYKLISKTFYSTFASAQHLVKIKAVPDELGRKWLTIHNSLVNLAVKYEIRV